ncbi:hypothetical protein FRB97_001303, partial [Tulasnella sp. 331]
MPLHFVESDGLLDRLGKTDNCVTDKAADIDDLAYLPGTQNAIFAWIEGWVDGHDTVSGVFSLSGPAGNGKTAVAAIIESRRKADTT